MSRRPGIGAGWFEKFGDSDVIPHDVIVHQGKYLKVPKYYDKLFEVVYPTDFQDMKRKRRIKALERVADNTPERLEVKETVLKSKIDHLKRGYENE